MMGRLGEGGYEKRRDQVRGEVGERIQEEKTREWHCGAEG